MLKARVPQWRTTKLRSIEILRARRCMHIIHKFYKRCFGAHIIVNIINPYLNNAVESSFKSKTTDVLLDQNN